jgi:hypothetical protein
VKKGDVEQSSTVLELSMVMMVSILPSVTNIFEFSSGSKVQGVRYFSG